MPRTLRTNPVIAPLADANSGMTARLVELCESTAK